MDFYYRLSERRPVRDVFTSIQAFVYPRAESNCYLMFRKHLFYPLNYRGNFIQSGGKSITFSLNWQVFRR